MSSSDPLDVRGVRRADDTVAEDYAGYLPDTRAEAALDLAVVDAFAAAAGRDPDARLLDAGCGAGRMSGYLAGLAEECRLVRRPQGREPEDQAVLLARAG